MRHLYFPGSHSTSGLPAFVRLALQGSLPSACSFSSCTVDGILLDKRIINSAKPVNKFSSTSKLHSDWSLSQKRTALKELAWSPHCLSEVANDLLLVTREDEEVEEGS